MKLLSVLCLLFAFNAVAQDLDLDSSPTTAPAQPSPPAAAPSDDSINTLDGARPATRNRQKVVPVTQITPATVIQPAMPTDRMQPGWSQGRMKHGIGFTTGLLGSNTFIYEKFGSDTSWTYYFGLSKASDTVVTSETTSNNVIAGAVSTTESNSGLRNPYALSVGASYNKNLYRSEWILVRVGIFGGLEYYTSAKYKTGTKTQSYATATPSTVSVTESAYGDVTVTRSPALTIGPMVDSFVYIRWFPQLAVGMQGGILYSTDSLTKTKTSTVTRSYNIVNGAEQTPTAYTSSETESSAKAGPDISTFAFNGTSFSLFGSFVLRYVW